MSTRLWLTAFDLNKVNSYLGSKDANIERALLKDLKNWLKGPNDKESVENASQRIKTLVNESASKSSKSEGSDEICAAYVLARHAKSEPQPWEDEDETEWAWGDILEVREQFEKRLDEKTIEKLDMILNGRGLFGTGFQDDSGWYSYFTNKEAKEFAAGLKKAYDEACKLEDAGALNEIDFYSSTVHITECLLETLSCIDGHDLFIFVS